MIYFAYGSNLDFTQMRKRCPSAQFIATARLVQRFRPQRSDATRGKPRERKSHRGDRRRDRESASGTRAPLAMHGPHFAAARTPSPYPAPRPFFRSVAES